MAYVASSQPAEVPTVEFEVLVYVWSRVKMVDRAARDAD